MDLQWPHSMWNKKWDRFVKSATLAFREKVVVEGIVFLESSQQTLRTTPSSDEDVKQFLDWIRYGKSLIQLLSTDVALESSDPNLGITDQPRRYKIGISDSRAQLCKAS